MAVPQQITAFGNIFASANAGPFFLDGSVWIVIGDADASPTPIMLRADDPDTASFAEVDAAGAPTTLCERWASTAEGCGGASGSNIPLAHAGGATNQDLNYSVFNTSSETWTLIDENAANNQVDNAAGTNIGLVLRSVGGSNIVATYPQFRKDMGTDYNHIYLAYKSGVSTAAGWTSNINVSAATVNDNHQAQRMCLGLSNRVHTVWLKRTAEDLMNRTFDSALNLQTEAAIDSAIGTFGAADRCPGQIATYDVAGVIHLNVPYIDESGTNVVNVATADSADNPSWTITAAGDHLPANTSNDLPAFSCVSDPVDATITHLFYVRASDDDIYHDERTDGGSWGTDTLAFTPSVGNAWGPIHLSGYDYGGGDVIGVYYMGSSGSDPFYDEYVLSAPVEIPVPAGGLVLAGQAPTAFVEVYRRPGAGTLTLAGLAPLAVQTLNKEMPTGALTLTGQLPTCFLTTFYAPPAGTLTLAGLAPSLLVSVTLDVPVGTLTFAGLAPALSIGFAIDVPVGALVLTGQAPALQFDFKMQPDAGALVFTGHVPGIGLNTLIDVPVGTLVLAGLAPTAAVPVIMQPDAGILTLHLEPPRMGFGIDMPFDPNPC